jgi:hypothetical protein
MSGGSQGQALESRGTNSFSGLDSGRGNTPAAHGLYSPRALGSAQIGHVRAFSNPVSPRPDQLQNVTSAPHLEVV